MHSIYLVPGKYTGYFDSDPYIGDASPAFNGGITSAKVDATFTPGGRPVRH